MARTGNGTSDFMKRTATLAAPTNFTMAFWYRNANAQSGVDKRVATIANSSQNTCDVSFLWSHPSLKQSFVNRKSGGAYDSVAIDGGTPLSTNTWYHIGGMFDGVNLSVWKNGANNNSVASVAPVTESAATLSLFSGSAGTAQFDNGTLAEFGYWTTNLTSAEMALLAAGISPLLIRTSSLFWYAPLINEPNAWFGGGASFSGTSLFTPHPKTQYASGTRQRRLRAPSNVVMQPNNINFQSTFAAVQSLVAQMVFSGRFDAPQLLQNNVNLQSVFSTQDDYVRLNNAVNFRSRFKADVGAIATGRFRGWFLGR